MATDYNKTLNLLKTDFPMRANLPEREPEFLKRWEEQDFYRTLMKKNDGKPLFILHDGPPYANGDMHMGHALNNILKDLIIRYKNMSGFKAPYIPGWDTHGLPIEQQAIKKLGINRHEVGPVKFREACRDFALACVDKQRIQRKRLGGMGDWENPYLTLLPEFEGKQVEIFGEMAEKGYIYKGLKPVYWCPDCETALAEAEIEYAEDPCDSIFVKFRVVDDKGLIDGRENAYFVIWTTTTWTLPGNLAICLNADFEYSVVQAGAEKYILASELADSVMKTCGIENYSVTQRISGAELEHCTAQHPFLPRLSKVIVGEHVTLEAGTGCVHTAPGFGADDFNVCQRYDDVGIVVPVDSKGEMTEEAGEKYKGMKYYQANKAILEDLKASGALLGTERITHTYPHCWRCKNPIIFRATEQWFASVGDFKDKAVELAHGVRWVPAWGEDRIVKMIEDRSDWCISRQRIWGVPIPIFYCEECGKELITKESIKAVADLFTKEGSSAWYKYDAEQILPAGAKCACGHGGFRKESDIMDVWFDSGSSHAAVLQTREGQSWPADVYCEGNDQYRGWFQSSLLTSTAVYGKAPYKTVLTHGMVVDGNGGKMSKSLGNGVDPLDIVKKYGADILRLWVVASDYRVDVRFSPEIVKQLSEAYRKIRNTARFILGNIDDFDPKKDMLERGRLKEIDRYILHRLSGVIEKVRRAYEEFEYHVIFHTIHNFCVVDLSNFYLDVIKDRLYVEGAPSETRRAAQTTMFIILDALTRLIAPALCFTAEEIWRFMPHCDADDCESVFFNSMPEVQEAALEADKIVKWDNLMALREDCKKALETVRAEKIIGSSLDAKLTIYAGGEQYAFLKEAQSELADVFIVSEIEIAEGDGEGFASENYPSVKIAATASGLEKCERCWKHCGDVGKSAEHPTLCGRCAAVVDGIK